MSAAKLTQKATGTAQANAEVECKPDNSDTSTNLQARINRLEAQGRIQSAIMNKICTEAERRWNRDFNGDGLIGELNLVKDGKKGRISIGAVLAIALCAVLALAIPVFARNVGTAGFDSDTMGKAMFTTDDAGTATLEVNVVEAGDVTEDTSGEGVTIDGVRLKDSEVLDDAGGLWDDAPIAFASPSAGYIYFEDFFHPPANTTTETNWTVVGDAGYSIGLQTNVGGILRVLAFTNVQEEVYMQHGIARTHALVDMNNDGDEFWYECRVKSVASNINNGVFIGLGGLSGGAANLLIDTTGSPATNRAYAGFYTLMATNKVWYFGYGKQNGVQVRQSGIAANNQDWHVFGMHFDGTTTLTPYIDGTAGTAITWTNTFAPVSVPLSPMFGAKNNSADSTTSAIDIDYIKFIKEGRMAD